MSLTTREAAGLKPGVGPIEQAVIGAEGAGPLSAAGRSEPEHADDGHQKQMEASCVLPDAAQSHEPVSEDMVEEGHVTTDSSDSLGNRRASLGPSCRSLCGFTSFRQDTLEESQLEDVSLVT